MADEHEPHASTSEDRSGAGSTILGLVLMASLIGGSIWAFLLIVPSDVPQSDNPSFLDNIFASAVVIGAARVVLLSAAAVLLFTGIYIVCSIVVRMQKRHWLRKAGPFESDLAEAEAKLAEGTEPLFQVLEEAWETNEDLLGRLEQRSQELERVYDENERLREQVAHLDEQLQLQARTLPERHRRADR